MEEKPDMSPTQEQTRRWLSEVPVRRSRRTFDGSPVTEADLETLDALCRSFRPHGDARTVLVRKAPEAVFKGIIGSYGKVAGASSALVFLGTPAEDGTAQHVGYTGEAIVLEATALGLETCWIGGSLDRKLAAKLARPMPGERVFAISPLGHAAAAAPASERLLYGWGKPKKRRAVEEIAPGCGSWPTWASAGVEAARIAPSAMNRQPWRFRMEDGTVIVSCAGTNTPVVGLSLDCGIAMLHFELAARAVGGPGVWVQVDGDSRDIARWVPEGA
jgi:Putative TM nitroreductase